MKKILSKVTVTCLAEIEHGDAALLSERVEDVATLINGYLHDGVLL